MEKKKIVKLNDNVEGNYFSVIYENRAFLRPISLPDNIVDNYALVIGYFPFSDKQILVYEKLNSTERAGFMLRYLLKCSKIAGVPQPIIQNMLSAKGSFDAYPKQISTREFHDKFVDLFKKEDFDTLKDEYMNLVYYENDKRKFEDSIKLLLSSFFWVMNTKNERKIKLDKIFLDLE